MKTQILLFIMSFAINIYAQPIINSFNPSSGAVGSVVTIKGTNFSSVPAENIVYFGAVKADVQSANDTVLEVIVPIGSTYNAIRVIVNKLTAYSHLPFVVTFPGGGSSFDANTLAQKVNFPNGAQPLGVATGDLDGDGKADLIITNATAKAISIFKNTGTPGNITYAPRIDYSTGTHGPSGVAIGDLNGDGKLDIVATIDDDEKIEILRNNSTIDTILFSTVINYESIDTLGNIAMVFGTGAKPRAVEIADLDNDGMLDIVVGNYNSNSISVMKNITANDTIAFRKKVDFPTGIAPWSVAIADFNDDQKADIAVVNYNSNTIRVFKANTYKDSAYYSHLTYQSYVDYVTGSNPFRIAVGDINNDGKIDLVASNDGSNSVSVFENNSSGGSIIMKPKVDYSVGSAGVVMIGDMDGDGKPDIVNSNALITLLRNNSVNGAVSFEPKVNYMASNSSYGAVLCDADSDGKLDVALTSFGFSTTSLSIFRYVGPVAVGIPSFSNELNLSVFPNPATENLTLNVNVNEGASGAQYCIVDMYGRAVMTGMLTTTNTSVTIADLTPGLYFLKIEGNKQVKSFKILKN